MELVEYRCKSHDKQIVVTICDADIRTYVSGKNSVLHICFLVSIKEYSFVNVLFVLAICEITITRTYFHCQLFSYILYEHGCLHIILFLREQHRVPVMGLASYNCNDIWDVDINRLQNCYAPFLQAYVLHYFSFGYIRLPQWLEDGGLACGDTVQVQFFLEKDSMYIRLGKNRRDWTVALSTNIDQSFKILFVVESAKENFFVIRDDLYVDYVLNGVPRQLRYCASCADDIHYRLVVYSCGHYMCFSCWKKWTKKNEEFICFLCHQKAYHHVLARLRDSPCPVDNCRSGDNIREYVLVPCGLVVCCYFFLLNFQIMISFCFGECVVRCLFKDSDGEERRICPYELCNKPVESKWPLYIN
ncbi:hypothetical protein DICVIV_00099 [Dictyocaulus viviparus]|uniref:RING-type domain-containing protein n=1 Tax=Dictyocaulus viviparus TaxID=29172 RepID=A0A0D8YG75_DICVI|nr:hypothetical protein DICVIV_00099 [Dictyocaulus viviparus]